MICCALFQPFDLWHAIAIDTSLQHKPLISVEKGKVKHANDIAKQHHIKTGMAVEGAKAHCETLHVIDSTSTFLNTAWEELLQELYAFTNKLESPEQGVVFLDLSKPETQLIAEHYQARVASANNKPHSHLLALSTKEGCSRVLSEAEQQLALQTLPLDLLIDIGIDPKTIERFHWLGLRVLGDVQKWSQNQLGLYLGNEVKVLLPYLKKPYDKNIATFTPSVTLKTHYDFEDTAYEPWQINPVIQHLVTTLFEQLGDKVASRLTVTANVDGLSFSASRISKDPINTFDMLYRLGCATLQDTGVSNFGIDTLTLELSGIYSFAKQGSLFQQKENKRLAIQKVEERFPGKLVRFEEVNPYALTPEFRFKLTPLGAGSEVSRESLSFNRRSSRRETLQDKQRGSLIHY